MGHTDGTFGEEDFLFHLLGGLEVTAGVVEDEACGDTGEESDIQLQAFADPASGPAPLTTNLSATALDPDGDTLTYKWTFSDGGSAFGTSIPRTYAQKGTYTATVTVSDGKGETASKELTITVGDSAPPVFRSWGADRTSGPAPLDVAFHAVASDPDGGKVTYRWEFGDGGSSLVAEADHTYLEPGTFTAKVTATDETGSSASKEVVITVSEPQGNGLPTVEAAAVPASGKAPLEVQFTAQGTDPDDDELTYSWDFGDGTADAAGRRVKHTYTANGTYTATVTADDGNGGTATDTIEIVVGNPAGNQPPTVEVAADRTTGTGPLKVNFSAAGNDPDGDPVTLVWDFGAGPAAAGTKVAHTFPTPGTYTVTVTATDPSGAKGTASVTITVTAKQSIAGGPSVAKGALRTVSKPSLATFRKRGLKVAATCEGTGKAAVGLWASKSAARKLGLKGRGLGRARFDCTAGETLQLTLKPSRKVRKAIKAANLKRLKLTVALALEGGDALTRKLTLKR
jgi:PKD repeat protein